MITDKQAKIIDEINDTEHSLPEEMLPRLIAEGLRKDPARTAVISDGVSRSGEEVEKDLRSFASCLAFWGAEKGDTVALMMEKSYGQIISALGTTYAGCAYSPIEYDLPVLRIRESLMSCGAGILVTDGENRRKLMDSGILDMVTIKDVEDALSYPPEVTEPAEVSGDDTFAVIFTSGSTGKPKGVRLSFDNMRNCLAHTTWYYGVTAENRNISVTNFCHDLSIYELYGTITQGGSTVIPDTDRALEPSHWVELINRYQVNTWDSVPTLGNMLALSAEQDDVQMPSMKMMILGGEFVKPSVVRLLMRYMPNVQMYSIGGPTEGTIWDICHTITEEDLERGVIPYGRPIWNTKFLILDDELNLLPPGEMGVMYNTGMSVTKGYTDEELTAERFITYPATGERMYDTGDLGVYNEDGYIEIRGRADTQVKIQGKRIELEEIENVLASSSMVGENAVSVRNERIRAFCTLRDDYLSGKIEDNWSEIFNDMYSGFRNDAAGDKEDFSSWLSSYTGLPIPLDEMREWRDLTLKRIDAIKGSTIFEIGCGTGLLLHRLAPECERYVGIDISDIAVENLRKELADEGLTNTEVYCRGAEDLGDFDGQNFDTIIINSVMQFFRSGRYLLDVIRHCGELLNEGGCLFIGDVRDYTMLELFHASVIFTRSQGHDSATVREMIRSRLEREKELTVAPDFFRNVCGIVPGFGDVRIQCKESSFDNELTRFRYDVSLMKTGAPGKRDEIVLDGRKEPFDEEKMAALLDEGRDIRIDNVVFRYAAPLYRKLCALEDRECGFTEQEEAEGLIPCEYHRFAEEHGCVCLAESSGGATMTVRIGRSPSSLHEDQLREEDVDRFVNEPYQEVTSEDTVRDIKEYAGRLLPMYMVPDEVIIMDSLPRLKNGKIDRKALSEIETEDRTSSEPEPEATAENADEYIKYLYRGIFREDVDPEASFFMVGGHSLLAMQLLSTIKKKLGVNIKLSEFMKDPTMNHITGLVKIGKVEAGEDVIKADRSSRYEPFDLNPIQQSYFFGRSSDVLGGVPTCMYLEFREEDLDQDLFEDALNRLVMRHDMMRAVICDDSRQRVLQDPGRISVTREEFGELPEDEVRRIRQEIYDSIYRMIDLTTFPSFICRIASFGRDSYIYMAFDSTFIDGASVSTLVRDLGDLYRGAALKPLAYTFRDYCTYTAGLSGGREYEESMKYWLDRIDTLPPAPPVQVISEKGDSDTAATLRRSALIGAGVWEDIKELASKEGLSLFIVQVMMFSLAVGRWCGEDRFTLNIPVFNRRNVSDDIADMAGEFGSLIFLEVEIRDDEGFIDNCRRLQRRFEEDMDHRGANGVEVIKEYRNRGRELFLPVVFTSLTTPSGKDGLYGREPELLRWRSQSSQVWIDSIVFDRDGGLELAWDCYEGILDGDMLDDMFSAYAGGLGRMTADEDFLRRSVRGWMEGRNRDKVLQLNETDHPYEGRSNLLHGGFIHSYIVDPESTACLSGEKTLTYREMYNCACDMAGRLMEAGVRKGDRVAVHMKRGWRQVAASLGILFAGAVYVPVGYSWPEERVTGIIERAGIRAVAGDDDTPAPSVPLIRVDERSCSYDDTSFHVDMDQDPQDVAYIIFTSGSTGLPKGVMIQHDAAVNTIHTINRMHDIGAGDRSIMLSEIYFDLSVYDIFGLFYAGGAVFIPSEEEKQDVTCWNRLLTSYSITVWNTVPAFMQMMTEINSGEATDDVLRSVMMSGDWIPLNLPERIRTLFPSARMVSMGGATEASIWSNYWWIEEVRKEWKSIPYGYPLDNQKMFVLDGKLRICPERVEGDIYIGGRGLAKEYLDDDELNSTKFVYSDELGMRLYFTGDRGRYHTDGSIEFMGRSDTQVKINGFRVELGEIESCALEDERLDAAIAVFDRDINLLALYYKTDAELSADSIRMLLAENLPDYMIPSVYIRIDTIPMNINGKVDRKQLPSPEAAALREGGEAATETEKLVRDIYLKILGRSSMGMDENFFRSGGDSIRAIMLLHSINESFSGSVKLTHVFANPTIRSMAAAIDQMAGGGEDVPFAETGDRMILSAAQKGIWFQARNAQMRDGAYGFVMAGSITCDAAGFDAEAFEKAAALVIEDNVDLRTEIYEEDYIPYRRYRDPYRIDLHHRMEEGSEEEVRRLLCREASSSIKSIDTFPLMDMRSAVTDGGRAVIALAIHHVIADAYSVNLILRRIEEAYISIREGREPDHHVPEHSYNDMAVWQIGRLEEGRYDEEFAYWKDLLAETRLMDFSYGRTGSDRAGRCAVPFTAEELEKFAGICSETGQTLYSGISAAAALMMRFYFERKDVVTGMAYAARDMYEFSDVIGSFAVSTIAVMDIEDGDDLASAAAKAAAANEEAIKHASLPFNLYVEEAGLDMDLARAPYNFVIDCLTTDTAEEGLFTGFRYDHELMPADMMLMVDTSAEEPAYMLYREDCFDRDEIEEYCTTLADILAIMTEDRNACAASIEKRLEGVDEDQQNGKETEGNDR